jgi:hypothetical protein
MSGNSPSVRLCDFFLANTSSHASTIKELIVRGIYTGEQHGLSTIKLIVWQFESGLSGNHPNLQSGLLGCCVKSELHYSSSAVHGVLSPLPVDRVGTDHRATSFLAPAGSE